MSELQFPTGKEANVNMNNVMCCIKTQSVRLSRLIVILFVILLTVLLADLVTNIKIWIFILKIWKDRAICNAWVRLLARVNQIF